MDIARLSTGQMPHVCHGRTCYTLRNAREKREAWSSSSAASRFLLPGTFPELSTLDCLCSATLSVVCFRLFPHCWASASLPFSWCSAAPGDPVSLPTFGDPRMTAETKEILRRQTPGWTNRPPFNTSPGLQESIPQRRSGCRDDHTQQQLLWLHRFAWHHNVRQRRRHHPAGQYGHQHQHQELVGSAWLSVCLQRCNWVLPV